MKKIILSAFVLTVGFARVYSQNVGIGTAPNTPVARLEVRGDGNTSTTNTFILRNLSGDTLLRMRNDGRLNIGYNGATSGRTMNLGGNGLNFFRTDATFSGAIFPTDTSIVMWSQTEDNNYVILQPSWGKVGIGTFSPQAKLDVNGSVILGDSGSVITRVIKVIFPKNLNPIPGNSASIELFPVIGARPGATVNISPAVELADGLLIAYARVSTNHVVEVKFMNVTSASIDPFFIAFFITVIL